MHKFVIMDPKPLRIYTPYDSPRLRYIAGILLGEILGLQWELTSDKRKIRTPPVINYSEEHIEGTFRIAPDGILSETGIKARDIQISQWKDLPVFFTGESPDFPFDIFAASFFLISRYEEYLDHQPDKHGRFRASSSIAFRFGFLNTPVVDLWTREMSKALLKKFRTMTFKRNEFEAIVTIDSDEAFAFHGKGILKSLEGFVNDLRTVAGEKYKNRNKEKDPYDTYDYIIEKLDSSGSESRFFFPVGDHSGFDRNPSWKNEKYRFLIDRIAGKFATGLHSSYYCPEKKLLRTEVERLRTILNRQITINRFHFLRFVMPDSFRILSESGIREDYSMGYPEEPGFRAGIARPFFFYDLVSEKQTELKIYPFQVMDVTLREYKKFDINEAREVISRFIDITRNAGGVFVSIWHNTTFSDDFGWQGWKGVFEFTLKNQENDSLS